jgi:long-chain fatty acid transport protein
MKNSAWSLALLALVPSLAARADDSHYQNILAGERGSGMGGAYTAIADDPSATYYNPAGLVDVPGTTLSASLAIYGVQAGSGSNVLVAPSSSFPGQVENSVSGLLQQVITIPGLAGSAHAFGAKDSQGRYKQAWGISVMVLDDSAINQSQTTATPTTLQENSQTSYDETTFVGFGYAYRVSDPVALGVSVEGFYRSATRQYHTLTGTGAQTAADGTVTTPTFNLNEATLQIAVAGLMLEGGVKWQVSPNVTLGFSLASPSVNLVGTGSFTSTTAQGSGLSALPPSNLTADTEFPVHGRAGIAMRIGPRTTLAADVSAWAPISYNLIGNSAYAAKVEGIPPNLLAQVVRNPVVNFNVGADGALPKGYALRGGLFTNFSSAPSIDLGAEPQLDDVNIYGATLGFKIPSGHETETTLGVVYSYGAGQGKTTTLPAVAIPETISNFEFCVGGSYDFK